MDFVLSSLHAISETNETLSNALFGLSLTVKDIKQQTAYEHRVLTPSSACKSENAKEFIRICSALELFFGSELKSIIVNCDAQSSTYPAFDFNW